ncbi:hypothetical protein N0V93_006469 [Gnomoniopsis smithogilvyi]|uniref:Uncharacterized protein n=1 Tax=Gnomoniopsis smithogilvyi TaxID=1191159 RepID=A0A9W8YN99_9PEZI|nr:hypothetical protein N0V93_006469 [Gnomoniopsis smithogilvyi]
MSQEPSAKRQRVDDGSLTSHAAPSFNQDRIDELSAKILALPPNTVQAIATAIVIQDPSGELASLIDLEHARFLELERERASKAISFAKYAGQADYILNEKYSRLSGSKQYDASGDVQAMLEAMLNAIVKRTKDVSAYATKKSAVETMRSIFETILDSGGIIGREVRNDCYDWDSKFLQVMGRFTEEELERLATEDGGAWVEQFRALVENASNYGVLKKLQESLDDLESYQAEEDEDGHEDEKEGIHYDAEGTKGED